MRFAQKLLSSKKGTIGIGAALALVSLLALVSYVKHVRSSVDTAGSPSLVLIAKARIHKGAPASAIANQSLYKIQPIRHDQLQPGAIVTPQQLTGTAAHEIYPGQQLTAADFTATTSTSLAGQIAGDQRAVALTFDTQHGLLGQLQAGDHVDVYVAFSLQDKQGHNVPKLRLLSQDVPVVSVAGAGATAGTTVVLEARNGTEAADFAFTSDNGKLWLTLRPATGAKTQPPTIVGISDLLFGTPPVAEGHR
jgi:Flp pilus assembly protein CpaB